MCICRCIGVGVTNIVWQKVEEEEEEEEEQEEIN